MKRLFSPWMSGVLVFSWVMVAGCGRPDCGDALLPYPVTLDPSASVEDDSFNRWGYMSKDGSSRIEPRFLVASSYKNGYAEVAFGLRRGIIDAQGQWVILPSKDVGWASKNVFKVGTPDAPRYLTRSGDWLPIDSAEVRAAGYLRNVYVGELDEETDEAVVYDGRGNPVSKGPYLASFQLGSDTCWVVKVVDLDDEYTLENGERVDIEEPWSWLTPQGALATPMIYRTFGLQFVDNTAVLLKDDGYSLRWGLLDRTGKEILPFTRNALIPPLPNKTGRLYAYGQWKGESRETVYNFDPSYYVWGIVNRKGERVVKPIYEQVILVDDQLAIIKKADGRMRLYDFVNHREGTVLFDEFPRDIELPGVVLVRSEKKWMFLSKEIVNPVVVEVPAASAASPDALMKWVSPPTVPTSLKDAIENVAAQAKTSVHVEWSSLEQAGIRPASPVDLSDLKAKPLRLFDVLAVLLGDVIPAGPSPVEITETDQGVLVRLAESFLDSKKSN